MNPELQFNEVATAIKHRCISTTEGWHVIYYRDRICCVPSYEDVPPEIILTVFTEHQVQTGFTTQHLNNLKTNIVKLYKELHK